MSRTRVLLVAAAILMLLLSACSSDDEPPAGTSPSGSASVSPPPQPTGPPAETPRPGGGSLLDYESDDVSGVTLVSADDTKRLTGSTDDFRAFIAAELAADRADPEEGCTQRPQIYVSRLDTRGWAAGGHFVPQCGGTATLWAKADGTWREVWSGQQLTDCATLEKYAFPTDVVGRTCLAGGEERPYRGAKG